MEGTLLYYAWHLAAALGFMTCVWLLSLALRNAAVADIFWGPGFVLLAWLSFFSSQGYLGRKLLMAGLVSLWGLRLALHIGARNWGKTEDRRYQAWRREKGRDFWWISLFTVFGVQGLLLWMISLVVQAGQLSPAPDHFTVLDVLGSILWGAGFLFEALGDWQLTRFKADPGNKGKVMNRGLWRYTRHPNYFGESLMWWGIYLIALSAPGTLWTIVSPVTITFLLLKVSGVTLLERTIVESRPGYREYQERTSAFIPWFPRKEKP
jgi:steroid 5-alpha reductase family enzyme